MAYACTATRRHARTAAACPGVQPEGEAEAAAVATAVAADATPLTRRCSCSTTPAPDARRSGRPHGSCSCLLLLELLLLWLRLQMRLCMRRQLRVQIACSSQVAVAGPHIRWRLTGQAPRASPYPYACRSSMPQALLRMRPLTLLLLLLRKQAK